MSDKKIMMEMTEKQAYTIKDALELYARLGMGQMDSLDNVSFLGQRRIERDFDYHKRDELLSDLKNLYFPDLYGHAFYGITNEKTSEYAKISWDIYQVMRHAISWHNYPEGGMTVNFDTPFHVSKESLCTLKYKKEK